MKERIEKRESISNYFLHISITQNFSNNYLLFQFAYFIVKSSIIGVEIIQAIAADLSSTEEDLSQESTQVNI